MLGFILLPAVISEIITISIVYVIINSNRIFWKNNLLYMYVGGIAIGFVLILWLFKNSCEPWERPKQVPLSAIWKGGCDGGNWIELVDIRTDTIRLRIYRDWNGELILDADFVSENCDDLQLTKTNWNKNIDFFDGIAIYCKNDVGGGYCKFNPILPAYYEEE